LEINFIQTYLRTPFKKAAGMAAGAKQKSK
jgi:hypothetical protein